MTRWRFTSWRRLFWDDTALPADGEEAALPPDPMLEVWDRQLAETGQVVFGKRPFQVAILFLGLVAVVLVVCPGLPIVVRLVGVGWLAAVGSIVVPLQYQLLTVPGPPMTVTDEGIHLSLDRRQPLTYSWADVERAELPGRP